LIGLQGLKLTFFGMHQLAAEIFFFSHQIEKCGRQKVSVKLFLCSETQAKIVVATRLLAKYWQSM